MREHQRTEHSSSRAGGASLMVFVLSLLLIGCGTNITPVVRPGYTPAPDSTGTIQPGVTLSSSSFYYFADGTRIQLVPSLEWIAVRFASNDPAKRAKALESFEGFLGPANQAWEIPNSQITVVPLKPGLNLQTLLGGINSMRADGDNFLEVTPVFQAAEETLILTDRFIAGFPAGMDQKEINAINSTYDVEIVEPILGQNNTYVLRRLPAAKLDTLGLANLYQESGFAVHAAPDFLRLTQR